MGIQIFTFGSDKMKEFVRNARLPNGEYSAAFAGVQYIVNHGSFRTLNTIIAGQQVPHQRDL